MNLIEEIGLKALHLFDPERAHGLSIKALKSGLVPSAKQLDLPRLRTSVAGLDLSNPIGLAAGFDKNAEVFGPLTRQGFGFIEVGAATPRPQAGNDKPRLFRLTEDRAVINRFGFNNDGMDVIADRLAAAPRPVPVGLNLGANKDSDDRALDYQKVLRRCGPHIDFATVNVSSPNTEKLRDLQGAAALQSLLQGVLDARGEAELNLPVFLKIAPDLTLDEITEIGEVAKTVGIDAIIATNTTLDREGLASAHAREKGGLSGAPLFEKSTRVLAQLAKATGGEIPIIGVGGVQSAAEAYSKICAGASAVQLYSALVYNGFSMVHDILIGLDQILEEAGVASVSDAVGTGIDEWL
jgi:dihydroorotate dehydrogenase